MAKTSARQVGEGKPREPARIEQLRVANYRALRSVEIKGMTPLTVLLGPNGSGKSTLFDVFNFLSECFQFGLLHAWDRRGRAKELRTRGQAGPIEFELKYRERPSQPVITYHLAIDERKRGPVVVEEWLQWRRGAKGKPFRFLEYQEGQGRAVSGEVPDEQDERRSTLRAEVQGQKIGSRGVRQACAEAIFSTICGSFPGGSQGRERQEEILYPFPRHPRTRPLTLELFCHSTSISTISSSFPWVIRTEGEAQKGHWAM